MIVHGLTERQIVLVASALELWPEWTPTQGGVNTQRIPGAHGLGLRPKNERFRIRPLPDDEIFVTCRHGHQAFIRLCFWAGATAIDTVLGHYDDEQDFLDRLEADMVTYVETGYSLDCDCVRDGTNDVTAATVEAALALIEAVATGS